MQILHMNVEDPCTVRRSVVAVLSEPQDSGEGAEAEWEDLPAPAAAPNPTPVRPKRRRGNDSVSFNPNDLSTHGGFSDSFLW